MRIPLCVVAGTLALSSRLGAQRVLTSDWFRVLAGQSVYTNMDSITRIGPETYRAVIINDTFPGLRDILTDEIKCDQHVARTIRYRSVGKHVMGKTEDRSEPEAPFKKFNPGTAADSQYTKICNKAQRKFASK